MLSATATGGTGTKASGVPALLALSVSYIHISVFCFRSINRNSSTVWEVIPDFIARSRTARTWLASDL